MIKFNPIHKILREKIDSEQIEDNIKRLTGYGFNTWRRLTGFFDGDIADKVISKTDKITIKGTYPFFEISCKKIDLVILINLEFGIIVNSEILLPVEQQRLGFGLIAHQNQTKIAKELGFQKIIVTAIGDDDGIFNGNVTWAKFGFTMTTASHDLYHGVMLQQKGETCLQKILFKEKTKEDSEKNRQFCNKHIPWWYGEFKLQERIINWALLDIYIHRKKYHPKKEL